VVCSSQPYFSLHHALLSACGSKWPKKDLMFTLYIDDSGTSPSNRIAISGGVIIPAARLKAFESEWKRFCDKEGISEFHTSECVARNSNKPFASWDDDRVKRVMRRVLQITFKYVSRAFCISILKKDYDEVVPKEMWSGIGKSHYIWAVSSVLGLGYDFASSRSVPMEYVFDNTDKHTKRDINEAIDYSETIGYGDHFSGHSFFRSRTDTPGLQLADFWVWHCFQGACRSRLRMPLSPFAVEGLTAFIPKSSQTKEASWATVQSLNRNALETWVKKTHGSAVDLEARDYKKKRKEARIPKKKPKKI
jgi:hypothetical protein